MKGVSTNCLSGGIATEDAVLLESGLKTVLDGVVLDDFEDILLIDNVFTPLKNPLNVIAICIDVCH